jgi:hypothetical protein
MNRKMLGISLLVVMLMPGLAKAYDFVVNGRITNSVTHQAISGVAVNGSGHGSPGSGFLITYTGTDGTSSYLTKWASTTTNQTGNYTISLTFPSFDSQGRPVYYIDYRLDLSKTGYQDTSEGQSIPAPQTTSDGSTTMVPN